MTSAITVISFSLWGDNPKYLQGAIENARIAADIYPNWVCRFYVGRSVWLYQPQFISDLESNSNCEVIKREEDGDWSGMFWRFLPCSDPSVDIMLSRDTDSRLSVREKAAVDEWLSSDKLFHIVRDHPFHDVKIMGGMWGAKRGAISEMSELINDYIKGDFWQVDQNFLATVVYPRVKEVSLVHDEFGGGKVIPYKRVGWEFIGDSFDKNGNRHPTYWRELKKAIKKRARKEVYRKMLFSK